jgi:hypothetical protein
MAATFYGEQQVSFARKSNSVLNVGNTGRLHNQCRVFIDRFIENTPRFVIGLAAGEQQIAAQRIAEFLHRGFFQHDIAASARDRVDVRCDLGQGLQN